MADWKKRLLRVKQKADQNLGRAEKTEVLTDDLHSLEKWVEQVKSVGHNTHKRLKDCIHPTTTADKDKKLKKLPEYMLATQMLEGSASLGQMRQDSLMSQLMKTCGDAQSDLAKESLDYEANVESGVLAPLYQLCEQDIPTIIKTRKNLSKMVLDMDSVKNRYTSALKQQSAGNMPQNKVDVIAEELEEASSKVQACKDQLSTDMYKFAASEPEYSTFLLHLVQAQADYHRKALQVLEKIIPDMQKHCDVHQQMPVYGTSLEEHLRRTNREIATVIEDCIATLAEFGLEEEGLFRIAGSASKVKKLKAAFDAGLVDMEDFVTDVHCIAGALKLYLRELPEPLMTYDLYDEWMAAAHLGHEERMQQLWLLCDRLPKHNFNNLRYLIKFLAKCSENAEVNKMSPSNIAIVIGPNLIWPYGDGGPSVLTTTTQSAIVESLIQHADYFFPGEISFSFTEIKDRSPSPQVIMRHKTSSNPAKKKISQGPAHNTLTATVSKPAQKSPTNQRPFAMIGPITAKQTSPGKPALCCNPDFEDRQSLDSGIGSSASASRRTSLKGNPSRPGEVSRPSIILENSTGSTPATSDESADGTNFRSRDCAGLSLNLSPLKTDSFQKGPSPLKTPPPRSVHSDMYDTVFALQSLGNGWSDYLTKVRNLWDGHMDSNNTYSFGSPGAPLHSGVKSETNLDEREQKSRTFRDRARASSESRLLDVPVKEHLDSKLDTSCSAVEQIQKEEYSPVSTFKRASFGGVQSHTPAAGVKTPARHSTAFETRPVPAVKPIIRPDRLWTGTLTKPQPAVPKSAASPPQKECENVTDSSMQRGISLVD